MGERKLAIITGGGTGVGAATALALAQRGYDLVVNYSRSEQEAAASAAACREVGADALPWRADVADDLACRAMVQAAAERWGRIDALVNNAGITAFGGTEWDAVDAAMFHDVMGVNVVGSFQMVRACAPHLKAAGGAVVNVSSIAGSLGIGSSAPYIASKGAINSLTLHMARTLAPQVRVNAVCPGMISTRWFVDGIGAEAYEKLKARNERGAPLGRICSAEDVADAVVWLIEGARTVTGETILLDGGVHLGAMPAGIRAP